MNQAGEALFRVDTPEREHNRSAAGPAAACAGSSGQVDPVGDDRDGIGQAETADLFVFLFARCVNAGGPRITGP